MPTIEKPTTQTTKHTLIGLFGGTFDPIHNGHLQLAQQLVAELPLSQLWFLPNHIPPHRPQPQATAQQRLAMVKLAIANQPHFAVEDWELSRNAPSYTIDTLAAIRQKIGDQQPLAFIIGEDSLYQLPSWHQWQQLTDYCHLVICPRTTDLASPAPTLLPWLNQHLTDQRQYLAQQAAGYCYFAHTSLYDVSATTIRQQLAQNKLDNKLLPKQIIDYIKQHKLYR